MQTRSAGCNLANRYQQRGSTRMAEQNDILTADIKAAAGIPASRLSEIVGKLGIQARSTRGGAVLSRFSVEDAARIVCVRRLQSLGLGVAKAAKAVRAIRHEDFKKIILTDAATWLVVSDNHAEVANAEQMLELAQSRGGNFQGLRLIRIDLVLRDIFEAKLQREQAMLDQQEAQKVTPIRLPDGITGAFLGRDLSLTISRDGVGYRLQLDAEQARSLSRELWALAEAKEPEVKN